MKPDMIEYIKKYPMWCGAGWIALLGVLAWLFQSWPGGFWGWLRETPNGYESGSTTVRNLGLIVAGLIALPLTLWRIWVADRQVKAAHRQVDTSQRSLLNEQYQKGAEMLSSEVLSVRLGGIYTLARLAREHPEEYHVQIMRLFCAYVRNPTPDEKLDTAVTSERTTSREILRIQKSDRLAELRLDIDAVMEAIAHRSEEIIRLERRAGFCIDLRRAKLQNLFWMNFGRANLYGAILWFTDLSGAGFRKGTNLSRIDGRRVILSDTQLSGANLYGASLWDANFTDALLLGADLSRAILERANLSGADLRGARGLTQNQLDSAYADPDKPPKLSDTLDAETGKPLVWRGRPLNDE